MCVILPLKNKNRDRERNPGTDLRYHVHNGRPGPCDLGNQELPDAHASLPEQRKQTKLSASQNSYRDQASQAARENTAKRVFQG